MRICIDPGHGGRDPGAVVDDVREADIVLQYALVLRPELEQRGHRVMLTRETDVFVPLVERAVLSNRFEADCFVSLHTNASTNLAAHGFKAFHARGSTRGKGLAQAIFLEVYPAGPPAGSRARVTSDQTVSTGYTLAAQAYARSLPASLSWAERDRMVREKFGERAAYRALTVLRRTVAPAVLLELAFLTFPEKGQKLQDPQTMAKLRLAVAGGVDEWQAGGGMES